eukprot:361013-Chlamydomonas_euryale.AAC.9
MMPPPSHHHDKCASPVYEGGPLLLMIMNMYTPHGVGTHVHQRRCTQRNAPFPLVATRPAELVLPDSYAHTPSPPPHPGKDRHEGASPLIHGGRRHQVALRRRPRLQPDQPAIHAGGL